jgi:hypothetical protein
MNEILNKKVSPPSKANLNTHLVILTFDTHPLNPPLPSLQSGSSLKLPTGQFLNGRSCKEGAIHRYAEHYESILRNKSILIFHYIILQSETKSSLKGSDFIVIFEPLSHDLPSLRSRKGKGVSMYETKEIPDRKDVYKD